MEEYVVCLDDEKILIDYGLELYKVYKRYTYQDDEDDPTEIDTIAIMCNDGRVRRYLKTRFINLSEYRTNIINDIIK